jgi:hypothetical protein
MGQKDGCDRLAMKPSSKWLTFRLSQQHHMSAALKISDQYSHSFWTHIPIDFIT